MGRSKLTKMIEREAELDAAIEGMREALQYASPKSDCYQYFQFSAYAEQGTGQPFPVLELPKKLALKYYKDGLKNAEKELALLREKLNQAEE